MDIDAARALPLVARLSATRDCFGSLMRVARSVRDAVPSHIELVHFPEGTDDDTIVRVLDGSPQIRDVALRNVGDVALERAILQLALKKLYVVVADEIEMLPDSLCFLRLERLTSMHVSGRSLRALPESIGQLPSLATLHLSDCESLAALPDSIGQLPSLETLNISNCRRLAALPESMGLLSSLETLDLTNCDRLSALPVSMG